MTDLRDPDTIGSSFVPRFREEVAVIPVADESVLYEEDTGALHQLDAIATVVCGLFDGRTPTGGIVDQLAEAFQADPAVIEQDVLRMVRDLARKGLFDGVEVARQGSEEDTGG